MKKNLFILFTTIVLSIFIIHGAFAEMTYTGFEDAVVAEPVDEGGADINVEVDEHNQFAFLSPGESFEDYLGSATSDLVYTPVTPCRIIDTRNAGGILGPNSGRQFQVNMSNYSSQGGYAGSCGIPINPAAVAINVASTEQTGNGHLRVIVTGGGIPLTAALNYQPGVNISNAGVYRSLETGTNDIFIYSGVSASHVVVDIMGYFAPPVRTPVDNYQTYTTHYTTATEAFDVWSPPCASGYRVTGGGFLSDYYRTDLVFVGSRGTAGTSKGYASGANVVDRWLCQGKNSGVAQYVRCFVNCARIPGR